MRKSLRKMLSMAAATLAVSASVVAITSCTKSNTVSYTFQTNGGEQIETVKVNKGETYELPQPEREGYSFEGWYTTSDYSGEAVTSVVSSKSETYYAKWEKMYKVTFDLDGGSWSKGYIYLKAGANIYEGLKDCLPTKGDLQFGAWYDGAKELLQTKKMPAEDITLTAKYKVEYTIEFYGQSLEDETKYDVKIAENVVGYALVGSEFTSEQGALAGYREIGHPDSVTTLVLSENKAENVFKHYYDRKTVSVAFNSNYPGSAKDTEIVETKKYGDPITIPSDYTYEGYCLIGWSTTPNGKVEYAVDSISDKIYNKDANEGSDAEAVTITPDATNTVLYAVWSKGYTDLFGGNDYIFLLDKNSDVIYLARGGNFFVGEYDAEYNEFFFVNYALSANGKTLLTGRLNDNGTYIYYDKSRAEYTSTLYRPGVGLVETETVQFGEADEITYRVSGEADSIGTYVITSDGYYHATFTEGPKAGTTMNFTLGYVNKQGVYANAFNVRNEEDLAIKDIGQFAVYNGMLGQYYPLITLDGFGGLTMKASDGTTASYSYTREEDILNLRDGNNQAAGTVKIHSINVGGTEYKGYSIYTAALDQTFKTAEGVALTLDGMYNATYEKDGQSVIGFYQASTSVLGGTLIKFLSPDGSTITFHIAESTVTEVDPETGDPVDKTVYTLTEKLATYSEHYYRNAENTYYAPCLILDGTNAGEASVYGYTSSRTYVKVLDGTYVYDEVSKLYVFTVTAKYDAECVPEPINIGELQSFVFALENSTGYNTSYWYSYVTSEGETTLSATYSDANGNATLTMVAGLAVYVADGEITVYNCADKGNYFLLTYGSATKYVVLNDVNKTFEELNEAPSVLYLRTIEGVLMENYYFEFDGKGGVTYYAGGVAKTGSLTEEGKTDTEKVIYVYTSASGETFKFIKIDSKCYGVYQAEYDRTYTIGSGRLVLDGYGYRAMYVTTSGTTNGGYRVLENGSIYVSLTSGARYFDVSGTTGTIRGVEYGVYQAVDNLRYNGWTLSFDGYGNYTVARQDVSAISGTYTVEDGKYALSSFTYGNETITWAGMIDADMFKICREEIVQTFVHVEDWSILVLDGVGNATKYNASGKKESGYYLLLTDSLFYYMNVQSTDACIYEYSEENGTITPIAPEGKSYYTADLEALQFTRYGFVVINGKSSYYYNEKDGQVTIYREALEGEVANGYGFVEEPFGGNGVFDDVVEFEGKTYYANSVFGSISFVRSLNADETEDRQYRLPVGTNSDGTPKLAYLQKLLFTPTGEATFSTTGTLVVYQPDTNKTNNQSCYVVRELNETQDAYVTYILIPLSNGANYRLDVEVEFNGVNESYYVVNSMRYVYELMSYNYQKLYAIVYSQLGAGTANTLPNSFGTITLFRDYDVDGVASDMYANGTFGEASNVKDMNGKLLSFENAETDGNYLRIPGTDGFTYRLYIELQQHQNFSVPGFLVAALTREEIFSNDTYDVMVGRVVATELSSEVQIGDIFFAVLLKNGESVATEEETIELIPVSQDMVHFVVKREDTATYYTLKFTASTSGSLDGTEVVPFSSVSVTEREAITVYTQSTTAHVDIDTETNEVLTVSISGVVYVVVESTATEDGYTIKTASGVVYKATIKNNTLTLQEVK